MTKRKKDVTSDGGIYDFTILRDLRQREGMRISDVSRLSGISAAVISKLERNKVIPELDTFCRLSRIFSMNPSDCLALAEKRAAQKEKESSRDVEGFHFREVIFSNVKCLYGAASAGSILSRPEIHKDDYELCWVLKGKIILRLSGEKHELETGDSIQFDALIEHSYEAAKDSEMLIMHIRKGKRF